MWLTKWINVQRCIYELIYALPGQNSCTLLTVKTVENRSLITFMISLQVCSPSPNSMGICSAFSYQFISISLWSSHYKVCTISFLIEDKQKKKTKNKSLVTVQKLLKNRYLKGFVNIWKNINWAFHSVQYSGPIPQPQTHSVALYPNMLVFEPQKKSSSVIYFIQSP